MGPQRLRHQSAILTGAGGFGETPPTAPLFPPLRYAFTGYSNSKAFVPAAADAPHNRANLSET
jgi:hypothetical protein